MTYWVLVVYLLAGTGANSPSVSNPFSAGRYTSAKGCTDAANTVTMIGSNNPAKIVSVCVPVLQ